jgi:tetratricopeptide (TPR) repeat protein
MKLDPLLNKAAILAKKRDYEGALRILRDEEDRYNGSFQYYYLYAVISLHAGSFLDAYTYFQSARRIKIKDPSTMLGLAVLLLKRMNTSQALDYYLDVNEMEPDNGIAKNALSIIRKHSTSDELSEWLTPEKLSKLYPPIPGPSISARTIINAALISCMAVILVLATLVAFRVLPSPFKKPETRPTANFVLTSQERSQPVETGGTYMYILTRSQALDLYDRALSLFTSYRDEAAKISLNRLLVSNASGSLKDKARLLISFMEVPGFDNFKHDDNPSYSDVKKEPVLYRDVHIIWKGMATNVELTDEHTQFELLVGYDTRRTLEGIVTVIFDRPLSVSSERPLEVLGKIVVLPGNLDIQLEGVAIHQSGKLETE